jgi:rSAM/selenodomain-associated transferase 2
MIEKSRSTSLALATVAILRQPPGFSIIIPCYRDETQLTILLGQLQTISAVSPPEIIVVDGAASASCRSICRDHKTRWLAGEPCRGRQLLAGALAARGEVLWFLHADMQITSTAFAAMSRAIDQGATGGFFRFRFAVPREWPALILEPAIALRCRWGVPYGDQGLFMLRDSYRAAGGHAPWPLFEEVPLVRNARRLGRFVALREPIYVNPRRWQRDGWWRRTWHNRRLALKFASGVAPETLAAKYETGNR